MTQEAGFYSLNQVAERLGLHVRTVRAYVRNGRLKAVRIGKQYRVAQEDLDSITGADEARSRAARRRRAEVSCVVQMGAVTQNTVLRMADHLRGAVQARRDDGSALRVETIYDQGHAELKVIVIGSLSAAANIFGLLAAILDG
ncbi:MAG TPA: helix-turn-helix domain-containing protein [Steroidobacteraceae bacterium]